MTRSHPTPETVASRPAQDPTGRLAVRLVRRTLEAYLLLPEEQAVAEVPAEYLRVPGLSAVRGVFVTLRTHPDGELRGCVGFPIGREPLHQALPRAALYAAREDPRFPRVSSSELPRIRLEVSLLTPPRRVAATERATLPQSLRVGVDGLILRGSGQEGLLLPQVAGEQGWDAGGFLEGVCRKAGLPSGAWREEGVEIFTFQAEVFSELAPGDVPVRGLPFDGSATRPSR